MGNKGSPAYDEEYWGGVRPSIYAGRIVPASEAKGLKDQYKQPRIEGDK